ncbi:MAG: sel1 repeat family protein, partial [Alphaproteobacteria bacterium]|nr:sel1 repeat family protein [Alphaproteobacteria bacterium]
MADLMNATRSGRRMWPGVFTWVVLALALAGCGGESLEAQVAAAEAEGEFTKAIGLWEPLAAEGDVQAIMEIAALYEAGPPAVQDFAKAAETYRQAADLGVPSAMVGLGMLY